VGVAEAQEIACKIETDLQGLPAHLVSAESWSYAAELGEVPGGISLAEAEAAAPTTAESADPGAVRSPMPARVVKVLAEAGRMVVEGQPLFLVQAMKMEFEVAAPRAGCLVTVRVRQGDVVEVEDVMARVEASPGVKARPTGADDEHAGDDTHAI
jgi:biotin carboxyl carrier protein